MFRRSAMNRNEARSVSYPVHVLCKPYGFLSQLTVRSQTVASAVRRAETTEIWLRRQNPGMTVLTKASANGFSVHRAQSDENQHL
jgi:hypothetical protein